MSQIGKGVFGIDVENAKFMIRDEKENISVGLGNQKIQMIQQNSV
jgi:hypothetical protein